MFWLDCSLVNGHLQLSRIDNQWGLVLTPLDANKPLGMDPRSLGFEQINDVWKAQAAISVLNGLRHHPETRIVDLGSKIPIYEENSDSELERFKDRLAQLQEINHEPGNTQSQQSEGIHTEEQLSGTNSPVLDESQQIAIGHAGEGAPADRLHGRSDGENTSKHRGGVHSDNAESDSGPNDSGGEPRDDANQEHSLHDSTVERDDESAGSTLTDTPNYNPEHFFITDEINRDGGFEPSKRLTENIAAIRVYKQLESESRPATKEEKSVMARYAGWGGLKRIISADYEYSVEQSQRKQFDELKNLLSSEEREYARGSALNAHFTAPDVIEGIWEIIERMGYQGGRVWEPAAGIGNFIGLMPRHLVEKSQIHAVEMDLLTGGMLKKIYSDANVAVSPFEKMRYPNNFFDLIISNIPFGNYQVADPDYDHHKLSIHNYFFVRSLSKVRPGGVVAFITSRYTMDSLSDKTRFLIDTNANLLGALRLPEDSQEAQAGTRVVTDVIFLQKKKYPQYEANDWNGLQPVEINRNKEGEILSEVVMRNRYYTLHPGHLIGNEKGTSSQYRAVDYTVTRKDQEATLGEQMVKAAEDFARPIEWPTIDPSKTEDRKYVAGAKTYDSDPGKKPIGTFVIENDLLMRIDHYMINEETGVETAMLEMVQLSPKRDKRVRHLVVLRETLYEILNEQSKTEEEYSEQVNLSLTAKLNSYYDNFVKQYGPINKRGNVKDFDFDPGCGAVLALENYSEKTGEAKKADIFSKRVIELPGEPKIESLDDALAYCLGEHGEVVPSFINSIADHLDTTEDTPLLDLAAQKKIWLNPESMKYEADFLYLSGNVKEKLKQATLAGEGYEGHVSALEAIQPKDIEPEDIRIRPGMRWVPISDLEAFVKEVFKVDDVEINYSPGAESWRIASSYRNTTVTEEYGCRSRNAINLLQSICNNTEIKVTYKDEDGRTHLDFQATVEARAKGDLIIEAFRDWAWNTNPKRCERLKRRYNDVYNNYVEPVYDGSHLTLPGINKSVVLRSCQHNAIWRKIVDGRILLAHEVGVGKTWEMVAMAMEDKRLGRANKSMIVVKNKMLEQFQREAFQLYPNAKIATISPTITANKKKRDKYVGQIAANDYDIVLVPYSVFEKVRVSADYIKRFIDDKVRSLRSEIKDVKKDDKSERARFQASKIETRIKNLKTQLERVLKSYAKDSGIDFGKMGIDNLFIDEAHNFKNMTANRSVDMASKIAYIFEKHRAPTNLTLATATPISNTLDEIHVMQSYLQPDLLEWHSMTTLGSWRANFITSLSQFEPSPSGSGFTLRSRDRLINAPEIMGMLRRHMDVVFAEDVGIVRPDLETITHVSEMSDAQLDIKADLAARAENLTRPDNLLAVCTDGRKMSLHPGLYDKKYLESTEQVDTKLGNIINEIYGSYIEHKEHRGTQLLFCDMGTPGTTTGVNIYDMVQAALVEKGIPEHEIAYIQTPKNDVEREALYEQVRAGEIRVMIGSSEMMSEGVNVQTRLSDLHVATPPWKPATMTQMKGRGQRYGNLFDNVRFHLYTTKGSMDAFMYSTLKNKEEAFGALLRGSKNMREYSMEIDPTHAEVLALTTDNPLIKDKLETDQALRELQALKYAHERNMRHARDGILSRERYIEEKQEEIEQLIQIPKVSDSTIWELRLPEAIRKIAKINVNDQSDKPVYQGEREGLLAVMRKLKDKVAGTSLKQLEIRIGGEEGVPVIFDQDRVNPWRLGHAHGHGFHRAADLESYLDMAESNIQSCHFVIKIKEKEIAKLKDKLNLPFEKQAEYERLRQMSDAIEILIQDKDADEAKINATLAPFRPQETRLEMALS